MLAHGSLYRALIHVHDLFRLRGGRFLTFFPKIAGDGSVDVNGPGSAVRTPRTHPTWADPKTVTHGPTK